MKRYKTWTEETSYYFITTTVIYWIPVFQKDNYFNIIIDSLKYCNKHKGLKIHGYVIMPTHLHLIGSHGLEISFPEIMRDFKHYTSTQIIKCLKEENHVHFLKLFKKAAETISTHQKHKIWKDEYHPVALTSDKWFREKLTYMHYNPVRKGFVELPEQWKYSSARNWLCDDHSILQIDKIDGL